MSAEGHVAARLEGVSLSFGSLPVLHEIDLTVRAGEFVAVVGPSGCGKTTLLGLLSGYLKPTTGGVSVSGATRTVYQTGGLFPWRTVRGNVLLGLNGKDVASADAKALQDADALLSLVGLDGFADSYPHELSGGMRQRAELARALGAPKAGPGDLLLMDEPFSAVDYLTRLRLRGELSRMLSERPRAVVLVTHDIEEAAQLADRIVVLTERPARVQREFVVETPRPRLVTDGSVAGVTRAVLAEMGVA